MYPHPLREVQHDTAALSQKGKLEQKWKNLHSNCLHTRFSQYDNNSRVPTCLRVQCTFSASQSSRLHPSRFHKSTATIQVAKVIPDLPVTLTTAQIPVNKKHENKLTAKFPVSFQVQFKTVSTCYTVQVVSIDLQYHKLNSNTSTTAVQSTDATWCIWEIKTNNPKQTVSTYSLSLSQSVVNQQSQSQHQVPPCLQCHDGS